MDGLLEEKTTFFSCKVCNNGSLKLRTMGVGAPMNHMKSNKIKKIRAKRKRNLALVQKSFSISSLVGKSSAVTSKYLQVVATTGQSASGATIINDKCFIICCLKG